MGRRARSGASRASGASPRETARLWRDCAGRAGQGGLEGGDQLVMRPGSAGLVQRVGQILNGAGEHVGQGVPGCGGGVRPRAGTGA
jgi:hypothetical protein